MADESNEGIAYLMALKRSATSTPGGSAANSAEANGSATPDRAREDSSNGANPDATAVIFPGAEKRRSPRYQCQGSIQIREVNCDVHAWASFTDINLHGCYVEAQATYPVGTLLLLKLEAKGIRVETRSEVRVSYPYLGMGIEFVEMTRDNQARLRDLLALVSRPSMIMGPGTASMLTARGRLELPAITNPDALVQSLLDFFRDRQMLIRDDFVRIVRQSQNADFKS